jgi:crotonobetainyl-CoA:carnitine CoA-transferase CaiB-like acyl-CoA transferase
VAGTHKPLEGYRVIEITQIMAGPLVGSYLGDMGADVVKIELPSGDSVRGGQNDLAFIASNRNKRSLVLDFKTPGGLKVLLDLAAKADVFLENSRPGVAERRGYGYEAIRKVNPRIIYCSVSAFGRSGPLSHKPAIDWIIQAYSGAMSFTGPEGGPPVHVGPIVGDFAGAAFASYGVAAALLARERFGVGQRVDVSLLDSVLHQYGQRLLQWPVAGRRVRPEGTKQFWGEGTNRIGNVPHKMFETSDGLITLGIQEEHRWRAFCDAIGHPELKDDPRFSSNAERVANEHDLYEILDRVFKSKSTTEWMGILDKADQYAGEVLTLEQVLDHPQIVSNKTFVNVDHPQFPNKKLPLLDTPVRLSETPGGVLRRPPMFGEHSREVLLEYGFEPQFVDQLITGGTVKELKSQVR